MSSSRHGHHDRFTECPGPCNPRNRICRRSCAQNVVSILEDLPPCLRSRLCQEDLLSVFATESENRHASAGPDDCDKENARKVSKPKMKCGTTTQTMHEKQVQTQRFRSVCSGTTTAVRKRTQDASIAVRNIAKRGLRAFEISGLSRISECSCCFVNSVIYVLLLLVLAIFARHSSTYQVFLSSQICGLLALLSWRICGTVPL